MAHLIALHSALRATKDSAYRQLGLRYVKDATALADRNPERVAFLIERAEHSLRYAEAMR